MRRFVIPMLLFVCSLPLGSVAQMKSKAVIAYYSGSPEALDAYDPRDYTHIIYCFGRLKGDALHLRGARDTTIIRKMVAMKARNPKLKVLLSLGGWGGCAPCSEVFSTVKGRAGFARSVKELTDYFGSDGIDLDWEYPTIAGFEGHRYAPEDKANFTELVRTLRQSLGRRKTVTFAAGGFDRFLDESVDWASVMPLVDYVNLMTYDLVGGGSKVTGHHTALFSTPQQKQSTDNCVQRLLAMGVPGRKMIIGAAFYARTWVGVAPDQNGRYQSGTFKHFIGYNQFPSRISEAQGFRQYWDSTAQAPFAYHPGERVYATFDTKQSIALKSQYVLDQKLGGIMFWQLGHDPAEDGLVAEIHKVLGKRVR
jgi:chitinase